MTMINTLRKSRSQQGFAIALVLIFAMFLMVFAMSLMKTASVSRNQGAKINKKVRAIWMARSGVQLTLLKIKELREEFYDALKWSGNGVPGYNSGVRDETRDNISHVYPRKHPFHNLYFPNLPAPGSPSDPNLILSDTVLPSGSPVSAAQFLSFGPESADLPTHYAYLDLFKSDIRSAGAIVSPSSLGILDVIQRDGELKSCIDTTQAPSGQCVFGEDPYTGNFEIVMQRTATGNPADGGWAKEGLIRLSSKLLETGISSEEYTEQDSIQIQIQSSAQWTQAGLAGDNYKTNQEEYLLSKIEKLERHR
ncbi:MAG: hypothetical protein CVV64_06765 [Candidatus Wallbacteria bacterium HGW-Wallbacteria-1]|jgi:hypothetical protein|uniref:Uncharacterized protein n=1 Tax=Candidatus Wallbacteria bacterium HGW-Wallbacteria-1 TaxID=2013854 RepID=A0A2N1PSY5_9BACT|nr:MAG: hypothetical protein CVV64_06765 [Candidatus Wallbacteria bacterium HGW-Wallbacteria-1]